MLITFAGTVAESRFTGRKLSIRGTDYNYAVGIACRIHSGEVLTKYWDYMEERARAVVAAPLIWVQIEVIASALLERGTLTGKQVRNIRREIIIDGKYRERFEELCKQQIDEDTKYQARIAAASGACWSGSAGRS